MNNIVFSDGTTFAVAPYPIEIEPCIFSKHALINGIQRDVLRITIIGEYEKICTYFVNNASFAIVETIEVQNDDGTTSTSNAEYDKSEYSIASEIVDHRDGRYTIYMCKPTDYENEINALRQENAALLFNNLTGEDYNSVIESN